MPPVELVGRHDGLLSIGLTSHL